ncbi:MAG TPA: hypothetical protein VGN83_00795 [Falsiroseomonas sp.]|nr:hypothetical protein [Falsiroseomonas sp.]
MDQQTNPVRRETSPPHSDPHRSDHHREAVSFNLSYLLVWRVCDGWDHALFLLVTIATLAVAVAGCGIGARAWRCDAAAPRRREVARFLGLGGVILSAVAALGILVGSVPLLVLHPCAGIP